MSNLIQFDEMPPEQHRELSAKGGKVSGEARRKKAAMREALTETMERYAVTEGFIDDIDAFRRWKKRRDEARTKRE